MTINHSITLLWLALVCVISTGCSTQTNNAEPFTNMSDRKTQETNLITKLPATDARIAVMGRSEALDDGSLRFAYPGVTLKFNFIGAELALQAHSSGTQSYLEVIVDGGEPKVIKLTTTDESFTLFNNTETADNSAKHGPITHSVELTHRSETWHGIVTLSSFEIKNGELTTAPTLPERRLLILGDSVTCGEAIERTSACKKDSSWWRPRLSYGMLAAEALVSQVQLVCYGGRGLVRSWNGRTDDLNLPDFADMTIADPQAPVLWNPAHYSPDLILSAIGTNDFSQGIPERELYVSTYVNLVQRLLSEYPNAQVVLTEGAILNGDNKAALTRYLQATVSQLDNPRVHIIHSNYYPGDTCDAHPTKAQHKLMAEDLTPQLRQLMHW